MIGPKPSKVSVQVLEASYQRMVAAGREVMTDSHCVFLTSSECHLRLTLKEYTADTGWIELLETNLKLDLTKANQHG